MMSFFGLLDLINQFVPESKLASGDSAKSPTPSRSNSTANTILASTRPKGNTSCERVPGRGLIPFELGPPITPDERFSRLLQLNDGLQEDGAECLTRLLSRLHEELGKTQDSKPGSTSTELENGVQDDSCEWIVTDRSGKRRPQARMECLTRLLSRLHEELGKTQDSKPGSTSTELENGVQDDSCEWIVTDRSGKRRPQARMTELQGGPSRIADLFSGVLITRSTVKHGDRLYTRPPDITSVDKLTRKATCLSTKEPFFILPLDINNQKVTNIESALSCLTESELITDYQDSTTGQSSHVNQRLILHRLPPYLLLQLKRFSYGPQPSQSNSALPFGQWTVEKSLKQLSISLELFIPPKLLSHETTFSKDERHYFLRAILFHVGRTAASGHYTVAVRWMDDSRVQSTSESDWQFLYLDDTRACLVRGSEAVRTLLSSHLPLDANSCLFYNLPRDISPHITPTIMKQPRTPYVLIYEATTQLHSRAVVLTSITRFIQYVRSSTLFIHSNATCKLSLSQFSRFLELLSHETTFSKDERHYFLRAILFHVGRTAASGHYTVAVRWMDDSRVQSTSESDWQFLYLDDTRACLVRGSEAVRTLLSSHLPLDANSCLFYNLPRDISPHITPTIMKQPRTPYVLIYEATTQLHSRAVV
ncbi:hypothetical protein AHF37_09676 [Paragonimus kellicotti]|nr:hypothetical protein AHF37_09676 [Paragonimus kellicotti]